MTSRLKSLYQKETVPFLQKELNTVSPSNSGLQPSLAGYILANSLPPKAGSSKQSINSLALPHLSKVVVAMGVGKALLDKSELQKAEADLALISGQKPKVTKAKKAFSSFKLQAGQEIGLMATLRGERMYQFLDKVFNVVFPRTRDFRGLSKQGFDGSGNFSLGFADQTVFAEINPGKVDKLRGLQITIVTTTLDNEQAYLLLKALGCPFKKE